jgi:hypothetical protein
MKNRSELYFSYNMVGNKKRTHDNRKKVVHDMRTACVHLLLKEILKGKRVVGTPFVRHTQLDYFVGDGPT